MNKCDNAPWIWKDRVAVITGGGGLLGRGMALAFARRGMDVVLADVHVDAGAVSLMQSVNAGANIVAAEVRALGRRALAVRTDVTDPASMQWLADVTYAEFGRADVLCNNAGNAAPGDVTNLSPEDWNKVLDVHVRGAVYGIYAFMPRMIAAGLGHIVNTASMSGVGVASMRSMNAAYVTAKFALVGLTESMAPALAQRGIGMSVLCPGMTVADSTAIRQFAAPSAAWYAGNVLGPDAVGEEVAHGIEEGRLHIFPHRAGLGEVEARHALLLRGFEQAMKTSPPLQD